MFASWEGISPELCFNYFYIYHILPRGSHMNLSFRPCPLEETPFPMMPLTSYQIQTPVLASLQIACITRNKIITDHANSSKSSHDRVHNHHPAIS